MKIGIIGPTENEINPFLGVMSITEKEDYAKLTFHKGHYGSLDVVALYSGVCKVNAAIAAQLLIERYQVSHVILSGVAGGIDNRLKIGDIVLGSSIGYHDVHKGILTEYHPWMSDQYFYPTSEFDHYMDDLFKNEKYKNHLYRGKIVTGEAFISKDGRSEIIEAHEPLCVDMETASVAHVCYANDTPFYAIRVITDTEEYCGEETFEENCVMASKKAVEILEHLLRNIDKNI